VISSALGKVFVRIPAWAKVIWVILTILAGVYCIARYGLLSFILHVLLSP
jgi:hypothetical protein